VTPVPRRELSDRRAVAGDQIPLPPFQSTQQADLRELLDAGNVWDVV
jgi:hypothetical protein